MPLSGPLTEQEIANGKEIFEALDQDNDGKISAADVKQALVNIGCELTDDEVAALISKADTDGSGVVTWDEFLKVLERRPIKKKIAAALRRLFDAFDTDNSGFITLDNLKNLVKDAGFENDITEDELKEMVAKVDTTGDGKVSFDEFLAIFME